MKHLIKISALLFITTIIYSCDAVDELTQFDVDGNFTAAILVDIEKAEEGEEQSFEHTGTINITENQDVQDNINLIENISITQLSYEFENYSGVSGAIITSASISFGNTVIGVNDLNIEQLDNGNIVFNVTNASQLNAIANALQSNPELTITISGTIDQSPATFTTQITIGAIFTVDPV